MEKIWIWDGKKIPLRKMHVNQLRAVKEFVRRKKAIHYGFDSKEWFDDCTRLIKEKEVFYKADKFMKAVFPQLILEKQ